MYFEFHHDRRAWAPPVDVCERAEELVILIEMPGVAQNDVKLTWHEGVLTISGQKRRQPDARVSKYHCLESIYGLFRRDIAINMPIESQRARAELRDGLMRIYLPKRATKPAPNEIPIS